MNPRFALALAACGLFSLTTLTMADDQLEPKTKLKREGSATKEYHAKSGKQASGPAFRVDELIGMTVKNREGKELGTVHDLVVSRNGQISYVAVSRGGVAGIGDNLHAIPWQAIQIRKKSEAGAEDDPQRLELGFRGSAEVQPADKIELILEADEQTLENDPGFNQDNWPVMANPKWAKHRKEGPQKGEAFPQKGEAFPQKGEALPQKGEALPQKGEALPQKGKERQLKSGQPQQP